MKITKVFGFVLFLHLGLIAVFILQPGCQTTQPPTRSGVSDDMRGQARVTESRSQGTFHSERSDLIDPMIVADDVRSAPRRPSEDFSAPSSRDQDFSSAFNPVDDDDLPGIPVAESSYTTHTVQSGDSLWAISRRYDASLNEVLAANNLTRDSVLRVGQQIRIPSAGTTVRPTSRQADVEQPSDFEGSSSSYTVQRGDTLSGIASRNNTTVNAIKAANNKSSDVIRIGETLVIPGASGQQRAPSATPSVKASTESRSASTSETRTTTARTTTTETRGGEQFYTVQQGDFPATIARQFGMTSAELLALNGITDPRRLQVGQRLRVRQGSESAPQATASQPQERTDTSSRPSSPAPVSIRTVEADPLPEGAFDDDQTEDSRTEVIEEDEDSLFDDAVEIPVIRVED